MINEKMKELIGAGNHKIGILWMMRHGVFVCGGLANSSIFSDSLDIGKEIRRTRNLIP
jgi:hypothetical protein